MRLVSLMIVLSFLVSCSMEATITPLPSGAVGIDANISLKSPTKEAWKKLQNLDPTLPVDPFDPTLWRQGLGGQAKIATTEAGTSVAFVVPVPQKLFPSLKSDSGSWDLTLDRITVRRLAALSAWGGSPALDSLIPSPETSVTQAEYRDLLVYLLGPETTEAVARALIDASTVQLTIVAPKPLLTAEGATINGNQAVYRWPLLRVLTLETPIHLRLTF
jgi:hypothetical protein